MGNGAGTTNTYTYTCSDGSRDYDVYTPKNYSTTQSVPLVVVLHGCSQSPSIIAADSQFNDLADQKQFIVVYPGQSVSANAYGCWNWYLPDNQSRGSGEPAIIAGIVQTVQCNRTWDIDKNQTYVTGLSAGAAMSVIMGVTYPDVFAAIGVGSGLEYRSASSESQALLELSADGVAGPNPVLQGLLAYRAMGRNARRVPTIVFHGTVDSAVPEIHGQEVVTSMAVANFLADHSFRSIFYDHPSSIETDEVPDGYKYTVASWDGTCGKSVIQYYRVEGMDHRWSGGATPNVDGADVFTDPKGPSFTNISFSFFLANPRRSNPIYSPHFK